MTATIQLAEFVPRDTDGPDVVKQKTIARIKKAAGIPFLYVGLLEKQVFNRNV